MSEGPLELDGVGRNEWRSEEMRWVMLAVKVESSKGKEVVEVGRVESKLGKERREAMR